MLRRAPKQERGQQRIERILNAAAQEFARVGYEETTTNAIARRAKTSVGSLYQFFPNKKTILYALAERYLAEMREMHERMLGRDSSQLPLEVFYDRLVTGIAEFHASRPGFFTIFYGSATSPELGAAAAQLHEECVCRAEEAIAARMPGVDPARCRLYARINVDTVKALMSLAATSDVRERVLAEIKALLCRYMGGVLEEFQAKSQKGDARSALSADR
jgi:AcrR family transcriptional regulator